MNEGTRNSPTICPQCGTPLTSRVCNQCGYRFDVKNELNGKNGGNNLPSITQSHYYIIDGGKLGEVRIKLSSIKKIIEQHFEIQDVIIKKDPEFIVKIPLKKKARQNKLQELIKDLKKTRVTFFPTLRPLNHDQKPNSLQSKSDTNQKIGILTLKYVEIQQESYLLEITSIFLTFLSIIMLGYSLGNTYAQAIPNPPFMYDRWIAFMLIVAGLSALLGFLVYLQVKITKDLGLVIDFPILIPSLPFYGSGSLGFLTDLKEPPNERDGITVLFLLPPLFGAIISLLLFIIGLFFSVEGNPELITSNVLKSNYPVIVIMITWLFAKLHFIPSTHIILSPISYIGLVGLIINGLNLLPITRLNGGRVLQNYFSCKDIMVMSFILVIYMLLMKLWVVSIFILIMTYYSDDIRPLDEVSSTSRLFDVLTAVGVFLGIICVLPVPLLTLI